MDGFDFLGVGNAVVDAIAVAADEELAAADLKKGRMHLVAEPSQIKLREKLTDAARFAGGSVANVTHTISLLGAAAAFIGKVGDDELGRAFIAANPGITLSPPPTRGETTAHCLVLVTPDAERTMQTFIAAGLGLGEEDIDLELVKSSRLVCLEGYLYSGRRGVLEKIAAAAHGVGNRVAFMLSDVGLVEQNRAEMGEFLLRHADILIANEAEAMALAATDDPTATVKFCRSLCATGAVTFGEKGSVVYAEGGEAVKIPAFPPPKLVDSTGAGDAYAAAFLHRLLRSSSPENTDKVEKVDIEKCGLAAARVATLVLGQLGARLDATSLAAADFAADLVADFVADFKGVNEG